MSILGDTEEFLKLIKIWNRLPVLLKLTLAVSTLILFANVANLANAVFGIKLFFFDGLEFYEKYIHIVFTYSFELLRFDFDKYQENIMVIFITIFLASYRIGSWFPNSFMAFLVALFGGDLLNKFYYKNEISIEAVTLIFATTFIVCAFSDVLTMKPGRRIIKIGKIQTIGEVTEEMLEERKFVFIIPLFVALIAVLLCAAIYKGLFVLT